MSIQKTNKPLFFIISLCALALIVFSIIKFVLIERDSECIRTLDTSVLIPHDSIISPENTDNVMAYIYNAPESVNDKRYEYHWEILKTALEKTKNKYGPYLMKRAQTMTEKRQLFELSNDAQALTVMFLDTKPDFEKKLLAIHIPVDKNLCGYRVLLIRKEDQKKFEDIKELKDLKKMCIGLGYGWIDVDILRSNKFNVMTGSNYEGLFKMLVNKRFDAFSRSAVEVLDEYEERKENLKTLKIEDSLLLYYPLPMYFWFSKKEKGKLLAQRAHEGMEIMLKDGTYDRIFLKFHGAKTEKLHLKKRRIFKITNPYLVAETPFQDKRLWYNPIDN